MKTSRSKLLVLGVFIAGVSGLVLWGWTPDDLSSPNCLFAQNAAWISVDWTSRPIETEAVQRLVRDASRRKIRYLFPYASYLKSDGTFSPTHDHAAEFVSAVHEQDGSLKVLAWIGIPLENQRSIGVHGWADLSQPGVRREIVDFAEGLVRQAHFDGVHVNAETVQNNDAGFLLLLDELRTRLGAKGAISIAGSHWVPDFVNVVPFIHDFRWTSAYYQAVGKRVDQIATMTYDSLAPHAAVYRWWMREQVKGISSSLAGSDAELLMGVSVSRAGTRTHRPDTENLASGLAGVCAGIGPSKRVHGIAVYADWEFAQSEWQVWQSWQR